MRALLVLLLVTPVAAASLAEETTGTGLQRDAGAFGDAADLCADPRALPFPLVTDGFLAPADDTRDFYAFHVPAARVGAPIGIALEATVDADLYLYEPGCATHLASSRSYTGREEIVFHPAHEGEHVLQILLFGPLADDLAPRASLVAYDLALR